METTTNYYNNFILKENIKVKKMNKVKKNIQIKEKIKLFSLNIKNNTKKYNFNIKVKDRKKNYIKWKNEYYFNKSLNFQIKSYNKNKKWKKTKIMRLKNKSKIKLNNNINLKPKNPKTFINKSFEYKQQFFNYNKIIKINKNDLIDFKNEYILRKNDSKLLLKNNYNINKKKWIKFDYFEYNKKGFNLLENFLNSYFKRIILKFFFLFIKLLKKILLNWSDRQIKIKQQKLSLNKNYDNSLSIKKNMRSKNKRFSLFNELLPKNISNNNNNKKNSYFGSIKRIPNIKLIIKRKKRKENKISKFLIRSTRRIIQIKRNFREVNDFNLKDNKEKKIYNKYWINIIDNLLNINNIFINSNINIGYYKKFNFYFDYNIDLELINNSKLKRNI